MNIRKIDSIKENVRIYKCEYCGITVTTKSKDIQYHDDCPDEDRFAFHFCGLYAGREVYGILKHIAYMLN